MSEKTCADCMALGQQLEAAQLEIQRLRDELAEIVRRNSEELAEIERDHRAELEQVYDEAQWEANNHQDW